MTNPFYGDWMQLSAMVRRGKSPKTIGVASRKLEALGNEVRKSIRGHIRKQDLDWGPLVSGSIKRKGFDKIYVSRGAYMKSITVDVTKTDVGAEVVVSPEGEHYSGLEMKTLAHYLEYGTKKMISRPLWRPVFSEVESMRTSSKLLKSVGSYVLTGME
jgi:hypothetical protein